MIRSVAFFLVLILAIQLKGYSQEESCEQTLARANDEFNAGHFYAIPSTLSRCLQSFSRDQKFRAYLLLTQAYLLLDDPIGARASYLEVLRADPEFIANESTLPVDIVYLSKKFTAAPMFGWFIKGGINASSVSVLQDIKVFNRGTREDYNPGVGYQGAIGADYYFLNHLAIRGEVAYSQLQIVQNTTDFFELDRQEVRERMGWISIPLTLAYHDQKGRYRPYGYFGYAPSLLLSDRMNITLTKVETRQDQSTPDTDAKESPNLNVIDKRNRFNQNLLLGGGVKIKIGLNYLFFDARYTLGLKNVVNDKNLYGDYDTDPTSTEFIRSFDPTSSWAHVDDLFRLDNASLNFGFIRPLYKPRELKKAHTRSVSRRIKKSGGL